MTIRLVEIFLLSSFDYLPVLFFFFLCTSVETTEDNKLSLNSSTEMEDGKPFRREASRVGREDIFLREGSREGWGRANALRTRLNLVPGSKSLCD